MTSKKVFLTGASGYIGGDALFALQRAHPEWEIAVLIRDEKKGAQISDKFPGVKLVIGSLDDADIIKAAASKADIVVHTADSSDHPGSARAIADGLRSTHSASNPGYYIHISGTGILTWYDWDNSRFGQKPLPEQSYDDLDGIDKVTSLPDSAFHRDVDKIVLAEAEKDPAAVKVAIVCPPTIYGPGRGPVNQRSRQVPLLVALTLQEGAGPIIGDGVVEWDNVHVHDLSNMIVLLAEQSLPPEPSSSESEIFGPRGYYFCQGGVHRWGELAEVVAKEAKKQGLLDEERTLKLSPDAAKEKYGFESLSWALNSKGVAKRGRKYLGWEPRGPSLVDSVPELVRLEAELKKEGYGGKPIVAFTGPSASK